MAAILFISTIGNDPLASARMSPVRRRAGNVSRPSRGGRSVDSAEPRSHNTPQSEKDPFSAQLQQEFHHAKGNSLGDEDNDEVSDILERWSSMKQYEQFPTEQNADIQATTTPPSFTPPTTPLAQAKSTLTVINPSAVESRRVRRRAGQRNDDPIDLPVRQIQIETELTSRERWAELLNNLVKTFLDVFRNPFFVPLCFVLALWCLISSFRASLSEIVHTAQSAGTAIGYCFSFPWQYAGAWMQSVWNTATPAVYQMLSISADVTISAANKTTVAVCSHFFGWLILTNLGLDCPFSVPYQPLDGSIGITLNNTTMGLSQIATTAVELLPYGRQLTFSEFWLQDTSVTVLESDLIRKFELSGFYQDYSGQIAATAQELTAFVGATDWHLTFQEYNLKFLEVQIERDNERSWWLRLFFPKEAFVRRQYLAFIQAADDDLLLLLEEASLCIELLCRCQKTNRGIQEILQVNRNAISQKVDERGILSRWLGRNEDLTRKTSTIDNMEEYLGPVLGLLRSILHKVVHVRGELSLLRNALKKGHVGATSPMLMVQMQIILSGRKRLQDARDDLRKGTQREKADHKQQLEDKTLQYKPMKYRSQSHADKP